MAEEYNLEESMKEMMALFNDPALQEQYKQKLGAKRFGDLMNLGLNIGDIATSKNQIRRGEELRAGIKDPALYTPTKGDENLQRALGTAQRDIYNTSAQLAPAELARMENYFMGQRNAMQTGQASDYGALMQANQLNNQRAGLQIASMNEGLIDKNRERYDSLLGVELNNNAAYQNRMMSQDAFRQERYYKELEEAAALESVGRSNRRDSLYSTADSFTNLIDRGEYSGDAGEAMGQFGSWLGKGTKNLYNKARHGRRTGQVDGYDMNRIFRGQDEPYRNYRNPYEEEEYMSSMRPGNFRGY